MRESTEESERGEWGERITVYNVWEQSPNPKHVIYHARSGLSGRIPGVSGLFWSFRFNTRSIRIFPEVPGTTSGGSGFPQTPENETEFEQSFRLDFTTD